MSCQNEEPQGTSSVAFRVPDFVGEDGVQYTDIDVLVDAPYISDEALK
jgi:hypothetical protein